MESGQNFNYNNPGSQHQNFNQQNHNQNQNNHQNNPNFQHQNNQNFNQQNHQNNPNSQHQNNQNFNQQNHQNQNNQNQHNHNFQNHNTQHQHNQQEINLLELQFQINLQRNILLKNDLHSIEHYLAYFKQSPGKKILSQLSIDYYRELYKNSRESSTITMSRYIAIQDKIIHKSINEYAEIDIVDGDFTLDNNNWYFLPYDVKLGESFLSNNLTQEDVIFTTSPEIPHLIFTYANHTFKLLDKSEVVLFQNIANVSTLDDELLTLTELNTDPNYRWRLKISRNDSPNNHFNLIVTSMIKLKESRSYIKDEFRYQFFKAYIAFLAAKQKGATEIHFGGKYLDDHVGKKRAIICAVYFAASLVGIKKIYFYSRYGYMDRADEIIQYYASYTCDDILNSLINDPYSENILKPNEEAIWQWYSDRYDTWQNYLPYLNKTLEEGSISDHIIDFEIENGKHVVDFDLLTDTLLNKGTVLKIRRLTYRDQNV